MAHTFWFRRSGMLLPGLLAALAGCGARQEPSTTAVAAPAPVAPSEPRPAQADASPAPKAPVADANLSHDIPTECASNGDGCVPPKAFAEGLCRGKFPEVAIKLFSKGMPWEKAYVKAEYLEPVNAYGGHQSEHWLKFGEEVLVIKKHGGTGGVQVSGPKDLDILRLDGTCATVRSEMLVSYVPGQVVRPHIVWKYLDGALQDALLADKYVKQASEREREACKGSSVTHPEGACDKAMKTLTDAIVAAVRKDIAVPAPEKSPGWSK
ncbi:MAG TPA: hypothetical protein VM686_33895 [Polyangiaceae bacterium]|nr:hypothetical protein [Polyangiaceae bacterium]